MPFDDPWLRAGKISPLEFERRQYAQTRNPIYVVRGYQICSELTRGDDGAITLPDWIREDFDHFASTVQDLFGEHVDDRPIPDLVSTLADALDFKEPGRGVRTDAFTEWNQHSRDQQLVALVRRERQRQPSESITNIVMELAEAQHVRPRRIWDALKAWQTFLDDTLR